MAFKNNSQAKHCHMRLQSAQNVSLEYKKDLDTVVTVIEFCLLNGNIYSTRLHAMINQTFGTLLSDMVIFTVQIYGGTGLATK